MFAIAGATALAFSAAPSLSAAELLLNGSFESPVQTTAGDHTSVLPDSWTVAANAYTNTSVAGDSNLVRGAVTGTGASVSISPIVGSQSLDGAGGDYNVSQSFTLASASALHIQVYIGGRDGNSATGTGSFFQLGTVGTLLGVPNSFTALYTSATAKPATGSWNLLQLNTAVLAAGTYRFTVVLGDPDHLDGASITNVPEPTTLTAAGLGVGRSAGWASSAAGAPETAPDASEPSKGSGGASLRSLFCFPRRQRLKRAAGSCNELETLRPSSAFPLP